MGEAKNGDTVKVHITGKLEDGRIFESTRDLDPLEFTIGRGEVIRGVDTGVVGMEEGETRKLSIPQEDAFGPKRDDLVVDLSRNDFPETIVPSIGQQFQVRRQDGSMIPVTVTDIEGGRITIDANHPLAGKRLDIDIELLTII